MAEHGARDRPTEPDSRQPDSRQPDSRPEIRLGLDRPRRLLAALGDPQRRFPGVLVAGTNGKGSTARILESVVRAGGYRTGLFTSPALERPEDQIEIAGRALGEERLTALLARAADAGRRVLGGEPTPFEALTAAAFLAFAEAEVELAVVEVGMGGARDATNVLEPEVAILTTVGLEHRRYLGDTRAAIAREKAGIFRRGRPALVGPSLLPAPKGDPEAAGVAAVLAEVAETVGAELHAVGEEVTVHAERAAEAVPGASRVTLTTPEHSYTLAFPLAGAHQLDNLALGVRAAEELARSGWARLDPAAVERGVAACRVPGRLETIPLPEGRRLLLDAAHDPQAVEALVAYLDAEGLAFDLLFGALDDKDAARMVPPLAERAGRVTLTRPPDPRGRDPRELLELMPPSRRQEARVVEDAQEALDAALAALPDGGCLLVTGSVVLVGAVRGLRH